MCHLERCLLCGKRCWAGCGQHASQLMAMVPLELRCECDRNAPRTHWRLIVKPETGNAAWVQAPLGRRPMRALASPSRRGLRLTKASRTTTSTESGDESDGSVGASGSGRRGMDTSSPAASSRRRLFWRTRGAGDRGASTGGDALTSSGGRRTGSSMSHPYSGGGAAGGAGGGAGSHAARSRFEARGGSGDSTNGLDDDDDSNATSSNATSTNSTPRPARLSRALFAGDARDSPRLTLPASPGPGHGPQVSSPSPAAPGTTSSSALPGTADTAYMAAPAAANPTSSATGAAPTLSYMKSFFGAS